MWGIGSGVKRNPFVSQKGWIISSMRNQNLHLSCLCSTWPLVLQMGIVSCRLLASHKQSELF